MSLATIRLGKAKSATEHLFEALHDEEVAEKLAADFERMNQLLACLTHANRVVDEIIIDGQYRAAGVQRSGATDGARSASTYERSEEAGVRASRRAAGLKGAQVAFYIQNGVFAGFHRARKVSCIGCGLRIGVGNAQEQGWPATDLCPECAKETEPESIVRRSPPIGPEESLWKRLDKPAAVNPSSKRMRDVMNILEENENGRMIVAEPIYSVQMGGLKHEGAMIKSREPGELEQGELAVEIEQGKGQIMPYFHVKGPNPMSRKRPSEVLKGNNHRAKKENKHAHNPHSAARAVSNAPGGPEL